MNDKCIYKSVQSAVKNPTHSRSLTVLETLTAAAPESALFVRFSLKHFRSKSLSPRLFGVPLLLVLVLCFLLLLDWTLEEGEERSAGSYSSHPACLLSFLCCVALVKSRFPICCIFVVSWVAPVFKSAVLFKSLKPVPSTKVTSSHVGSVCQFTDGSLGVCCYLHVIRAGNERQLLTVIKHSRDSILIGNQRLKIHFKTRRMKWFKMITWLVYKDHFLSCMW